MLHLLKEKSKIGIAHKDRKKYDAFMPLKRLKLDDAGKSSSVG